MQVKEYSSEIFSNMKYYIEIFYEKNYFFVKNMYDRKSEYIKSCI